MDAMLESPWVMMKSRPQPIRVGAGARVELDHSARNANGQFETFTGHFRTNAR